MAMALSRLLCAASVLALCSGPSSAGNGNVLYLLQESDFQGGSDFVSDQSAGAFTTIGTSPEQPATQRGGLNTANIFLSSDCAQLSNCGTVALVQDNSLATLTSQGIIVSGPASGNSAKVTITGTGQSTVSQVGDANAAEIRLDTGVGSIDQTGVFNVAKLQINGAITGSINQTGNSNLGNIEISGSSGASVTLVQTGNNLSYAGPYAGDVTGPPMTVTTTGTVTITQTAF